MIVCATFFQDVLMHVMCYAIIKKYA